MQHGSYDKLYLVLFQLNSAMEYSCLEETLFCPESKMMHCHWSSHLLRVVLGTAEQ